MFAPSSRSLALAFALACGAGGAAADTPALEVLLRKTASDPLLAGINADEALVEELRASLLDPWAAAWRRGDAQAYAALFAEGAQDLAWDGPRRSRGRERDGIREYEWKLEASAAGPARARRYLRAFSAIDDLRLDPARVLPRGDEAELDVLFDLRGRLSATRRRHDRGRLSLTARRVAGRWRLARVAARQAESLESRRVFFEDATASYKLDSLPVTDRREAIRRGGYAVAVGDYDGDGKPDMMVGGWGPLRLLRNEGGRFADVTARAGLREETLVKAAAFADLDNDGRKDLLLLRFVEPGKTEDDLVVYWNRGDGSFERQAGLLPRSRDYDQSMPLAVADFDGNGALDLYLGFPGQRDFTNLGREPQRLTPQGVWLNDGRRHFAEAPWSTPPTSASEPLYPHSVVATDLDGDGKPDLIVTDDRSGLSPIYRNAGGARFVNVAREARVENYSWGMTAIPGDFDGDGLLDIALTNIDLLAAHRILDSRAGRESGEAERAALERVRNNMPGNRLFRNRGDGTFEEVTDRAGIRWSGDAPAGAAWIDFNNDGRLDLYVSNGLWTGGERDLASLFARLHVARDTAYADQAVETALDPAIARPSPGVPPNQMLSILRSDAGLAMAGAQRNRLFRNNGDGSFTEVAYLVGADRAEDGYVAATLDVDGDGRQDLLLRNGDPAPGRSFPTVVLLRNVGAPANSLSVALEGARSNRDGVGARLTAWVGGRRLLRETQSVAGAAQSEPGAYFGLGAAAKVERLTIAWPSGLVEELRDLRPGRLRLQEGQANRTAARER